MERTGVLEWTWIWVEAVVETDRSDGQFVAQPDAERVAHVREGSILRRQQKITGIGKHRALQLPVNREGIFGVEHGEKLAADRVALGVVRAEIAFGHAAHRICAAVEERFDDRR